MYYYFITSAQQAFRNYGEGLDYATDSWISLCCRIAHFFLQHCNVKPQAAVTRRGNVSDQHEVKKKKAALTHTWLNDATRKGKEA